MIKDVTKVFRSFAGRCSDDHMGAYAATCAYFLIISFIPFFMIFFAACRALHADFSALTDALLGVIPDGLKSYVRTIVQEVDQKTYAYVPVSIVILVWSAAKVFHALSNGLNVISKVKETRGWFFLRFRSMVYVLIFMLVVVGTIYVSVSGQQIQTVLELNYPVVNEIVKFVHSFQILFEYIGLILIMLFIYKFLPNCRYTFKSQLPGALIVSTVWMFFSYLLGLYYSHNANFSAMYGTLTGLILAMIWIYFCAYFILIGAELNRVLYEDPDGNIFVQSVDVVRDARSRKREQVEKELDEYSIWRPIRDDEEELQDSADSSKYDIRWEDEKNGQDQKENEDPEQKPDDKQ